MKDTPSAPKKLSSSSAAQRTNVLLEAIQKDVRLVAEAIVGVTTRLDRFEAAMSPVPDEVKSLGNIARKLSGDLEIVRFSTARTGQEIENVKTELRLIRSDLTALDKRLATVESRSPL